MNYLKRRLEKDVTYAKLRRSQAQISPGYVYCSLGGASVYGIWNLAVACGIVKTLATLDIYWKVYSENQDEGVTYVIERETNESL